MSTSFEAARTASPPFRLAPPPRRVPWSVAVRMLFGGLGVFAWLWLGLGSGIGIAFLRKADLLSWLQFRGELTSASGVVIECRPTGASEGGSKHQRGTPIYGNAYWFEEGAERFEGISYQTGTCLDPGTAVTVEHPAGRPTLSRIAGMRRSVFGPAVAFVIVFPLVGLGLVVGAFWQGRRALRLIAHGKLAMGTLLGIEATRVTVNKRPVMLARFAILTDAGARVEVEVRTTNPEVLEDEPQERILYDPTRPRSAVAWDLLPAGTSVDAAGQIRPGNPLLALLLLVPPALAVAAHALALRIT